VPVRPALLFALAQEYTIRGERKMRDCAAGRCASDIRVRPGVSDQDHAIYGTAQRDLLDCGSGRRDLVSRRVVEQTMPRIRY